MQLHPLSDLLASQLGRQGALPLYRQLYEAVRQAIDDGKLMAGWQLPSSRALAADLGVSRVTVVGAYDMLRAAGYVAGSPGSGTYVAGGPPRSDAVPATAMVSSLSRRGQAIFQAPSGLPDYEGAFVPGVSDVRRFPQRIWSRLQSRYSAAGEAQLMGYANLGGFLPLRRALAQYLRISQSVSCEPDQIIITFGTNQSLDLCARLLTDEGDHAYVENPCYWGARAMLTAAGLKVVPCAVDRHGIVLPRNPRPLPKLLYLTPGHQFPLGAVLAMERRRTVLELAREHGFWVLEDDYDSEFRYDGAVVPSLQGMDKHQLVIYMGTFSKVMYPGMRLSYLVVPPRLVDVFSLSSQKLYRPGHLPLQAAVADFMLEGHFSAHVRKMQKIYARRQEELRWQFTRNFGEHVRLQGGHAGLHLVARFPPRAPLDALTRQARTQGILLRRLADLDCRQPAQMDGLLLGYGAVDADRIGGAVRQLARLYEALGGRPD